jgi:TM2 domain-containing membrane protein YozV
MKKHFLIFALLLALFAVNIQAQTFSQNKLQYDYHRYMPQFGDPFNPALSGVCSVIIPGLGQMVCGEVGRGLAFLGGTYGSMMVGMVGLAMVMGSSGQYDYPLGVSRPNTMGLTGAGLALVGFTAMTGIYIWSIVDAVNVAKVNNMYIQHLRKTSSLNLELAPYLSQISVNNQVEMPVGLSLRVTF